VKIIATNKKARFEYELLESFEAGIVLMGPEIKSARDSKASLQDSYAAVDGEEVFLYNMYIAPYEPANRFNHEPRRKRKLLLRKSEIRRIAGKMAGSALTVIPTKVYLKSGKAKVEIALARGKKKYDKREAIKKRELDREARRSFRGRA
jgi:SsrA-binding protein